MIKPATELLYFNQDESMHLWNEYVGKTLAGYSLDRLDRSEGRSAFFTTSDANGSPALLRLTESHFDDKELITRWQKTSLITHSNVQVIKSFGGTTFDGVSLAYCVLEPVDAALSDVVGDRVLSTEEVTEIAKAVAGALDALHAAGLVHEHVEASNIFAVGEIVKLRSDCVRECVGHFEADTPDAREALRQGDVRDLGKLLLRCFGLESEKTTSKPPAPFDRVIPQVLNGTLNAKGVVEALVPPSTSNSTQPVLGVATASVADGISQPARLTHATTPGAFALAANENERQSEEYLGASRGRSQRDPIQRVSTTPSKSDERLALDWLSIAANQKVWIASACAAILVVLLGWGVFGTTKHTPSVHTESKVPSPQATATQAPNVVIAAKPSAIVARKETQTSLLASGVRAGWHVIAYTYNYERQAAAKVSQLNRRYVGLQPQVFSPTGRAPYFVALGGSVDAAQAKALRNRARQIGLPSDTYARNF